MLLRRALGRVVGAVLAASLLASGDVRASPSAAAARGTTTTFPYRQRRLLYSRNASGGLAYVTTGAAPGAALPVVVFLHGMNADEIVHPWFGAPYGDLRSVVEPLVGSGRVTPFVLAAPTHTRFATAANVMWPLFDVDDFLDATEAALSGAATLDRGRVIVIGHSGAGCNVAGGILGESVRRTKLLALIDVDGCVDETTIPSLALAAANAPVTFFWQRTWPRPVADLAAACPTCTIDELAVTPGMAAHAAILPEALRRYLPSLLPGG